MSGSDLERELAETKASLTHMRQWNEIMLKAVNIVNAFAALDLTRCDVAELQRIHTDAQLFMQFWNDQWK